MESFKGIAPVEFKVLIKPDDVHDKSAGGIYLSDMSREREQFSMDRGTVMARGEGFFSEMPGPKPKVGDKVLFNKYAGTTVIVEIDGSRKTLRLCNDKDIIAILEE